ncbi:MAG: DNA polymerase I, partial [Lachnospiraceae bacterium]|nr:DNA polymerase I [Lachnospiraceae bacterium]
EADDILGTLAKRAEALGYDVTLVSGDRDLLQIASDRILVRIPKTKGGKTEIENYHTADVIAKYGLEPLQIIELKGLMGDSSDNIPGVPKIGEKTATELLKQYHDIDNLKDHIPEITKNSIRQSLTDNFDMAILSRTLATIDIDADIELDLEDAKLSDIYTKEAYTIVKDLGFKNMLDRFDGSASAVDDSYQKSFTALAGPDEISAVMNEAAQSPAFSFYADDVGIAITLSENRTVFIPAVGADSVTDVFEKFSRAVLAGSGDFCTFDLKSQLKLFPGLSDCDLVKDRATDVWIGAYLCNPLKNDYTVEDIANEYCDLTVKNKSELFGKKSLSESFMTDPEGVCAYMCTCSYVA